MDAKEEAKFIIDLNERDGVLEGDELLQAQKIYMGLRGTVQMRSCWGCNAAHLHQQATPNSPPTNHRITAK